jgi:predicted nuclease of predicted toxin-antitoxin system
VKFLADMGISMSTVASLREAGYDSVHLRDEGLLKMDDAEFSTKPAQKAESYSLSIWILAIC